MIQDGEELKLALGLPYKAYGGTVPMMCSWPSLTLVTAVVNEIVVMILLPAPPTILPSTETAHKRCKRSWATMLQPVISGAQLQNGDIVQRMLLRITEMAEHFICSDGNNRSVWGLHLLRLWPLRQVRTPSYSTTDSDSPVHTYKLQYQCLVSWEIPR